MSYPIEIVPLGKTPADRLESVCKHLNDLQQEFNFRLAPIRWREEGAVFQRDGYKTSDVFAWLEKYRNNAKGHRPFLIAFVNKPLQSDMLSNLFGSHEAEKGVAVVTLDDHQRYATFNAYAAYYLVRYAISFVAPEVRAHDDETRRWCVFDKKIDKSNLRRSLLGGRFCDDCMSKLQNRFTPEILASLDSMATLVKELETKRERPLADPVPPRRPDGLGSATTAVSAGDIRQPRSVPIGFAILGGIAFLAAILLIFAFRRSASDLADSLQYLATVIALAVAAAVFFFAVLHSYARYRGEALGGVIELGGPIVMGLAVGFAAYRLVPPAKVNGAEPVAFDMTVHARDEHQQPVTDGALLLTLGQETKIADLNSIGEGTFKGIGGGYREKNLPLEERIDDFVLKEPAKLYEIVARTHTVELLYDGSSLDRTNVSIGEGPVFLVELVSTWCDSTAGAVQLDSQIIERLGRQKITFLTAVPELPLRVALERVFAKAGIRIKFEKEGSVTWIRAVKP